MDLLPRRLFSKTENVNTTKSFKFFDCGESIRAIIDRFSTSPSSRTQRSTSSLQQRKTFVANVRLENIHEELELVCHSVSLLNLQVRFTRLDLVADSNRNSIRSSRKCEKLISHSFKTSHLVAECFLYLSSATNNSQQRSRQVRRKSGRSNVRTIDHTHPADLTTIRNVDSDIIQELIEHGPFQTHHILFHDFFNCLRIASQILNLSNDIL
mmetsp:Transcript_29944/g.54169  ORF Transcript_29944/g.54169 Transcript_29944/m.54169 type:complete len:211 (-) Transcript_29944:2958-3590(-)